MTSSLVGKKLVPVLYQVGTILTDIISFILRRISGPNSALREHSPLAPKKILNYQLIMEILPPTPRFTKGRSGVPRKKIIITCAHELLSCVRKLLPRAHKLQILCAQVTVLCTPVLTLSDPSERKICNQRRKKSWCLTGQTALLLSLLCWMSLTLIFFINYLNIMFE